MRGVEAGEHKRPPAQYALVFLAQRAAHVPAAIAMHRVNPGGPWYWPQTWLSQKFIHLAKQMLKRRRNGGFGGSGKLSFRGLPLLS
jgi:hypothetical protein